MVRGVSAGAERPWLRFIDPWATSGALFNGTGGGWGLVEYPPSDVVRVEIGTALTDTISFALVEVSR